MKFLGQLDARYPSCALLAAINARRFLDGEPVCEPGGPEFEVLVDICRCRYGAAIRVFMPKIWRIFGFHTQLGTHAPEWIANRTREGRPVELSLFTADFGLHSVLAIEAKTDKVLLVNWEKKERTTWVPWGQLKVPPYALHQAVAFALRG